MKKNNDEPENPLFMRIYRFVVIILYGYANASPVNFIDPTGYFSLSEMLASFQINTILDGIRCTALSALRNAAIGSLAGALFGGIDAGLGGRNIVEGALNGSISSAAFGSLATFSSLRPLLGIMGVGSGIEGVASALEEENYSLAAWRAAMCISAIVSLKKDLFNKSACFTEDTLIYTKDGYKQIKDIEVGDEVYSENPDTGEQGLKRVLNVFVKDIKELIHLKVGEQEIKTTATHPFWVEGIGWVGAGELKPGDRIVMYSGEILEVKEAFVEYLDKPVKVYNFEVEDWHTYFVSEYNVFVHNAGCGDAGVGKKPNYQGKVKSSNGQPPENFTPEGAGRSGAFNEAKRASDIPTSKQPYKVEPAIGNNGKPIEGGGRDFYFKDSNLKDVIIREHFKHIYPDSPFQNRGTHFNDVHGNHYDY